MSNLWTKRCRRYCVLDGKQYNTDNRVWYYLWFLASRSLWGKTPQWMGVGYVTRVNVSMKIVDEWMDKRMMDGSTDVRMPMRRLRLASVYESSWGLTFLREGEWLRGSLRQPRKKQTEGCLDNRPWVSGSLLGAWLLWAWEQARLLQACNGCPFCNHM